MCYCSRCGLCWHIRCTDVCIEQQEQDVLLLLLRGKMFQVFFWTIHFEGINYAFSFSVRMNCCWLSACRPACLLACLPLALFPYFPTTPSRREKLNSPLLCSKFGASLLERWLQPLGIRKQSSRVVWQPVCPTDGLCATASCHLPHTAYDMPHAPMALARLWPVQVFWLLLGPLCN